MQVARQFWGAGPGPIGAAVAALLLVPLAGFSAEGPKGPVVFDRDVRPILSENCFACHGFDAGKRQAGLRLDTAEGAHASLKSGRRAVVPRDLGASELVRRVTVTNALAMPPAGSGKKLTAAQVETLRRWVAEGGEYRQHWAFVRPKRPLEPPVRQQGWARNPIDRFILARLESEGLRPSPEADRRTLIRRVSFDLTGLPPSLAEVNTFLADTRPGAYERLVDRLLASPHFGERMALMWLDLARYADTHGYHIDSHRDMWKWREWVIDAFNRNLPFDQFALQQLAGDLLTNATLDQKVATGFNRNHPINFEGGAIPEEYQNAYIVDRIDTTATAFMGLTLKCAQCHEHKYDPFTQKDFYRLYAFFHNVPEEGLDGRTGNAKPFLKVPTPEQERRLKEHDVRIAALESRLKERAAATAADRAAWEQSAGSAAEAAPAVLEGLSARYALDEDSGPELFEAGGAGPNGTLRGTRAGREGKVGGALKLNGSAYAELGERGDFDRTSKFSAGAWVQPEGTGAMAVLSRMDDSLRGWDLYLSEGKAYVHLIHQWEGDAIRVHTRNALPAGGWRHLFATYDGSGKAQGVTIYVDGKSVPVQVTHNTLTGTLKVHRPLLLGRRASGAPYRGLLDEVRVYDREVTADEVAAIAARDGIREALTVAPAQRTAAQRAAVTAYYLEHLDPAYREVSDALAESKKQRGDLDTSIPTTMVMEEMEKPRDTFLLVRGQYDRKGEKVAPGVPEVLLPLPVGAPVNRLALAKWLIDPAHPLTARVAVNHYWQKYFGTGLVRTAENFGTQGERPSHPELLDWLATEFVRTGWDVKAMQRLIVTSASYRQESRTTTALQERDPENRLLARGPRCRLPAEMIRDQALAVSGLLVPEVGGPSVRPYQPPGLWEDIAFGGNFSAQTYVQDHGEKLYRRTMYTFWKRTCPPPSLQTFDAPEREFCMVRRSVSNTPLQALVLMNDPTYVEAARRFAERLLTEVAATPKDRILYAFRLALARDPHGEEYRVLLEVLDQQLARFRKEPEAAKKLLAVGESPRNERLDPVLVAAWTGVATVIFNLDEMVTKS